MADLIPAQFEGKSNDLLEKRECADDEMVKSLFQKAKGRLLQPWQWKQLCGALCATFEVLGSNSEPLERPIVEGDYIRISLPGPSNPAGDSYDWVRVEAITNQVEGDNEKFELLLRPCAPPFNPEGGTAHFFDARAV